MEEKKKMEYRNDEDQKRKDAELTAILLATQQTPGVMVGKDLVFLSEAAIEECYNYYLFEALARNMPQALRFLGIETDDPIALQRLADKVFESILFDVACKMGAKSLVPLVSEAVQRGIEGIDPEPKLTLVTRD